MHPLERVTMFVWKRHASGGSVSVERGGGVLPVVFSNGASAAHALAPSSLSSTESTNNESICRLYLGALSFNNATHPLAHTTHRGWVFNSVSHPLARI